MDKNTDLLNTVKGFCTAWFEERDLERTLGYLSEDVSFVGTGEAERTQGLENVREYIMQDMEESETPFELEFMTEQVHDLSEDAGIVIHEFNMKNNDHGWHIHGTYTLTASDGRFLIRHVHFAVPASQQEPGEHYPLTLVKRHIADARRDLLISSVAGGMMGGYREEKFPFYYINDRMLEYLGYDSEAEFVADIGGYISNCMHPEDQAAVDREVEEQLARGNEYVIEYRMRKKNGSYIYVQDIGRTITAEDGRPAIISVCIDISEKRMEQQQNESLMKAVNGGTITYKKQGDRYIPVYLSAGMGKITGYTKEELEEFISGKQDVMMHPKDREKFCAVLQKLEKGVESIEETYRIRHKDGHYVWVTGVIQRRGEQDGAPLVHGIFTSLSNQFELQNNILDGTDTGIYVIDSLTHELYMANEAAFRIMETPVCDYSGQRCFEVFAGRSEPCDNCMLCNGSEIPEEKRIPWLDKTVLIAAKNAWWMDKAVVIEYLHDVTEQKRAQEELKLGEERLTAAIQHAGIQFWEYDIRHDKVYISEFTQQSYQVPQSMENYPDSFLKLGIVHPDDEEDYRNLHKKLKNGEKDAILEFRARKPGEDYCWMLVHYTNSFDEEGHPVRAFATAESSDRYKQLEEQFSVSARLNGMRVWTLDLQAHAIYLSEKDAEELGVGQELVFGTEEALQNTGLLHPDDVAEVWRASMEVSDHLGNTSFKARLKIKDKYRWNKFTYTVIRSKGGVPVKVIGSSIDIHEHILLEQRFRQELEYSAGLEDSNLINKAQCNITRGSVDSYLSNENTSVTATGAVYDEAAENLVMAAVEEAERQRLRHLLSRKRVLEAYANGENYYTIDYRRRGKDGGIFWANTTAKTYQNPDTGDIMSFMYTYNIDEKRTAETIVDRVVDTNFEYLALFSVLTGVVERTIDKSGIAVKPEQGRLYEETMEEGLFLHLLPEEREEILPQFTVKAITDKLKKNDTCSVSADIFAPETKELRHKLWTFNWFDKYHTKVLCSRSDITDSHRQEQHQREVLSAALTAAKQANAAKSDFLSRMSHEIRTPMNAIIGMTAIAAKSIGNEEQVADCISKIGISSRFLLSLINDILDMSRIESGKMLLKNEKIPFKEFVTGVNTICHTQASVKDVEYECVVDPAVDECYIGDAMKLQQVLINILGNAVKFMGSGGKVTFTVTQRKRTKNDAVLRFVINDTGIGMSEEFLPHLFEPFEQESLGITAGFGGTGLGLAISKNIVDMMDGNIQVRSIKGLGTEFTVDVKLGITEEAKLRHQKQNAYNFAHLKTLVVDDDIMVCESAILTLKEIGITAEWVDSGRRAVERVREKWDRCEYYDMILVDWKMPEMDGIETSRRIRKIVGPDVTIIIMTAYDWYSIEKEAKEVGVNLLMSKPMFKSTLISAFSRALNQKEEEEQETMREEEYDFSGKRLLLVEDHPINAEIAKLILEDVGFAVELAENGLRAIEMFSKTEKGYYDAILMDIRMPVMDGLQASTNIRHLSNKDAKTIPIIAMTADAFDEDADRCKAAGMNLHLAKPIDPPKLYRTLYDFICGGENPQR